MDVHAASTKEVLDVALIRWDALGVKFHDADGKDTAQRLCCQPINLADHSIFHEKIVQVCTFQTVKIQK